MKDALINPIDKLFRKKYNHSSIYLLKVAALEIIIQEKLSRFPTYTKMKVLISLLFLLFIFNKI